MACSLPGLGPLSSEASCSFTPGSLRKACSSSRVAAKVLAASGPPTVSTIVRPSSLSATWRTRSSVR
jgi:hypothetical protein